MNKKVNTLLFIVCATIFNILVTLISFFAMFIPYTLFLLPSVPEHAQGWGFPIFFIGSLSIAFLVYRAVMNFLLKKIEIEKYFDPLFVSQQRAKQKQKPPSE